MENCVLLFQTSPMLLALPACKFTNLEAMTIFNFIRSIFTIGSTITHVCLQKYVYKCLFFFFLIMHVNIFLDYYFSFYLTYATSILACKLIDHAFKLTVLFILTLLKVIQIYKYVN